MQVAIKQTQMSLWNEVPVIPRDTGANLVFSSTVNDESEVTAQTVKLLSVTAGKGKDCLAKRTGLTGDKLKAAAAEESIKLKEYLVDVAQATLKSGDIGGQALRFTKGGRMVMTFKKLVPQVQMLTDEEHAKQLGCTVEALIEFKKKNGVTLKPAPQNGHPELIPAEGAPDEKEQGVPETPKTPARRVKK
jgi:hypothetical protein